jgi:hypothetical protein
MTTSQYWEIGKMCLTDEMPRNTESTFLSRACAFVKAHAPQIELIFTWADGMLGKPGYVYQASGFLYGGFSWTDSYFTATGEKVHPRQTGRIGGRPNDEQMREMGWTHYRGKQFRYVRFLCGNARRKELLRESTVAWTTGGAKHADLAWKAKRGGAWVDCAGPSYSPEQGDYYRKRDVNQNRMFA